MTNTDRKSTNATEEIYIGLMSGTSIDSLDAAMLFVTPTKDGLSKLRIGEVESYQWQATEQELLHGLCEQDGQFDRVHCLAQAGNIIATRSAQVVNALLKKTGVKAENVVAIGSHGQTVYHAPHRHQSVQIDNGPLLAALTGIDAIVNFRAADLAVEGEGAPLAQLFHSAYFGGNDSHVFMLNLGGIANVTQLTPEGSIVTAFDIGPANTLIDLVCRKCFNQAYDEDGALARSGTINFSLLEAMYDNPYFSLAHPKSTGREYFNEDFLTKHGIDISHCDREEHKHSLYCDYLATLTELTCHSVIAAIEQLKHEMVLKSATCSTSACASTYSMDDPCELIVAGGGADNAYLMERLSKLGQERVSNLRICSIRDLGIKPQAIEPAAFAYFAALCTHGIEVDLKSSTGAQHTSILGCICPSTQGHYVRLRRLHFSCMH